MSETCKINFQDTENPDVKHLVDCLAFVRKNYSFGHFMRLQTIRQGDMQVEGWFKSTFLVEDKNGFAGGKSYRKMAKISRMNNISCFFQILVIFFP